MLRVFFVYYSIFKRGDSIKYLFGNIYIINKLEASITLLANWQLNYELFYHKTKKWKKHNFANKCPMVDLYTMIANWLAKDLVLNKMNR